MAAVRCRCHLILASLRGSSSKGYQIPRGFLFDYITCANYTCEVFAWVCFAISVQTLAVFIFIAAGAAQMCVWAQAKHKRLRKVGPASTQAEMLRTVEVSAAFASQEPCEGRRLPRLQDSASVGAGCYRASRIRQTLPSLLCNIDLSQAFHRRDRSCVSSLACNCQLMSEMDAVDRAHKWSYLSWPHQYTAGWG